MTASDQNKFKSVGSKRRKKIEVRVAELVVEEMALREFRKAHHQPQSTLPAALPGRQSGRVNP